MLISAVITTHKRKPEIVERALISILSQSHKEMEITVVDDSPADYEFRSDVKKMVESYSEKGVRYIAHSKCMGACAARNTGLEASKGDFIGFLDDDDEWLPNKIEEQLKGFVSEDIALVYCGNIVRREPSGEEKEIKHRFLKGYVYNELILENFIDSTSFPLIRTDMLRSIGGFDIEMQSSQDYDVWLRLAEKYPVNFIDKPLVKYYFHEGDQITKNPSKKVAGLERLILKNFDFIKKDKNAFRIRYMKIVPWYAKNKQYGKAFGTWFMVAFKFPFKVKYNLMYLYSVLRIMILKDKA